jgi:hypothetical protein
MVFSIGKERTTVVSDRVSNRVLLDVVHNNVTGAMCKFHVCRVSSTVGYCG